jgi:hypothetical protein
LAFLTGETDDPRPRIHEENVEIQVPVPTTEMDVSVTKRQPETPASALRALAASLGIPLGSLPTDAPPDQQELLALWRSLPPDKRETALRILRAL